MKDRLSISAFFIFIFLTMAGCDSGSSPDEKISSPPVESVSQAPVEKQAEEADAPSAVEKEVVPEKPASIWDEAPGEESAPVRETQVAEPASIWDEVPSGDAAPKPSSKRAQSTNPPSIWDDPESDSGSVSGAVAAEPAVVDSPRELAAPKPRTGSVVYPGEVITWLGDFETLDQTPAFRTNSGANAFVVQEPDSDNRVISLTKPKGGVGALIFDLKKGLSSGASGIAFSYKGNTPEITFDPTVTLTNSLGKEIFIDPNFRAGDKAMKLDSDEWQTAYVPFSDYGLDAAGVELISNVAIFNFGPQTGTPTYLDDFALVRVEEDVVDLKGSYTEAPVQPTQLYFTKEDFPEIREKIEANPTLTKVYERVKARAAEFRQLSVTPYSAFLDANGNVQGRMMHSQLLCPAFVGLIEDDPDYLQHAVDMYLSALEQFGPTDIFLQGKNALQVGDMALPVMIGYDWLNPYMTDEQRLFAKNRVYEYANWIYSFSPKSRWGDSIPEREVSNWNMVLHAPVGIASLLLGGQDEWEALATRKADAYLQYSVDASGASRESGHYLSLGSSAAYSYIKALRRLKGIDLLAPHRERLSGTVDYFVNMTNPWGGDSLHISQGSAGPDKVSWFLELGNYLNEPLAYWLYYRLYGDPQTQGGKGTWGTSSHDIHKAEGPFIILAWDDSVGVESPEERGMPLAQNFANNQAAVRTGWDDDATLLSFKADEILGGWSHADDNSFILMSHGEGVLGDPGAAYYHARHHNAVLIDDKGQGYVQPGHNTGAEIIRFEDSVNCVTITGDATEAYAKFVTGDPHLPVEQVLRELCFVRAPMPMLVIVDRIRMQDTDEHSYSLMYQYGIRNQPSEIVLSPETNTIYAQTENKRVKTMTRILWPQAGVTLKERPDIENRLSTVEVRQTAKEAIFVSVIVPVPSDEKFPVVRPIKSDDVRQAFKLEVEPVGQAPFTIEYSDNSFSVIIE